MNRAPLFLLYINVLVIATCGLIYELLAGTLASYVLGDSVTQFSLVIGVYLSALGVGAWLSGFIKKGLAWTFLEVELGVALLGGCSAPLLFFASSSESFALLLYGLVFAIGTLVGLELPLLMRILKEHLDFSDLVARVLTFDYIGALFASVLFPLILVPRLGLVRTSLVFGMLNAGVALWGTWLLAPLLPQRLGALRARAVIILALLFIGIIKSETLTRIAEEQAFAQPIVHAQSTPYQRIVVTQGKQHFQLHLNGNLQFNSSDEYRYHEALVHPALSLAGDSAKNVLVLGGGDGLAVREIFKHPQVKAVTLVDIDPAMTALARDFAPLAELNEHALDDPRVTLVHDDAMVWLKERDGDPFDAVIIDFPDPNTFPLGKLYTRLFYRQLRPHVKEDAVIGIQCTSPLIARQSYWCILRTMEAAGFHVVPYHATVPSFGVWGYALASPQPLAPPRELPGHLGGKLRFLDTPALTGLFELPPDIGPVPVEINRLDNQRLVRYYEQEAASWE